MHRWALALGSVASALVLLLVLPGSAFAHERRTIGNGKYDVVVGFDKEPAFVNQVNAASIRIMHAGTEDAVEGVDQTLKVDIASGGNQPREFPLRAVFGQKGYYVAHFIPTKTGSYIFTFTGNIEGTPINERFESGPGRFNDVEAVDNIQVPQGASDPLTSSKQVKAVQDEVGSARMLAIAGLATGVIGIVVGGSALVVSRQTRG